MSAAMEKPSTINTRALAKEISAIDALLVVARNAHRCLQGISDENVLITVHPDDGDPFQMSVSVGLLIREASEQHGFIGQARNRLVREREFAGSEP
jgi:predicted Rdx family selenoprotein